MRILPVSFSEIYVFDVHINIISLVALHQCVYEMELFKVNDGFWIDKSIGGNPNIKTKIE